MSKSLKDQVPKCCMHMMVNNFKDFVKDELLACLYRDAKVDQLMEESAVEAQRRQELMSMYQTSKEALRVIGEINQGTVVRRFWEPRSYWLHLYFIHRSVPQSEPLPPPVENNIVVAPPKVGGCHVVLK